MHPSYAARYEELERGHWWWRARRRIVLGLLERLRAGRPGRPTLLDAGCGAGSTLSCLPGFSCRGLEPDPRLAEAARRNSGAEVRQGGLGSGSPFSGERFDFVLLLDVLEHLPDDLAALREVRGLLEPGGCAVINVPALPRLWSRHDEANRHLRRYEEPRLRELIARAGLEAEVLRPWGAALIPGACLRALASPPGRGQVERYRVRAPGRLLNAVLEGLLCAEFRFTERLPLPWGLSLLAVARRAR